MEGVVHSEFNPSRIDRTHLLQIWVYPERVGLQPRYGEKHFSKKTKKNHLKLIGSKTGREDSLMIHQNVDFYASCLEPLKNLEYQLKRRSGFWIQMISGVIKVNDLLLKSGDAIYGERQDLLRIEEMEASEFFLFDLGSQ